MKKTFLVSVILYLTLFSCTGDTTKRKTNTYKKKDCLHSKTDTVFSVLVKKNGMIKGWKLIEFLDFDQIKNVKIRNVNGLHNLTPKQWSKLKIPLKDAKSVGGIICKPQQLALFFEFNNKKSIEGYICGDLINFEYVGFNGSFKLNKKINFHNY